MFLRADKSIRQVRWLAVVIYQRIGQFLCLPQRTWLTGI